MGTVAQGVTEIVGHIRTPRTAESVCYYLVLFKSYSFLPAQVAQPINYMWPIVLLVLLAIFDKQPIPGRKYIGMVMSLGGVAFISLGGKGE